MRILLAAVVLLALGAPSARAEDTMLYDFEDAAAVADWAPGKLAEVKADAPAPKIEVSADGATSGRQALKLTFDGGDWPVVTTSKIPVAGDWKAFRTLRLDLTTDRPLVAYVRILQTKLNEKGRPFYYERTMILVPGKNEMVVVLHDGFGAMNPKNGDIVSFTLGAFRPEKGQTLSVDNVRLSADWPWIRNTEWNSPYNHDGYSSAAQREFARTGASPKFKVLGTDLEVADLADLAKRLKGQWVEPAPKTVDQVETEFRAQFDEIKKTHPKAVLAVLRDGEKGWDPAAPEKVYAGWKMAYISTHAPDGPNAWREDARTLGESTEIFMRHRSPMMQADLSVIPKGAEILAAKLLVVRRGPPDKSSMWNPFKANMWAAEPCNREWDPAATTCYTYAAGKLWKAVSGMYYGEDPDYWPVFIAHGLIGTGEALAWDFTDALKFWNDGTRANHGFFLYGDGTDCLGIYTMKAKEVKQHPAILVIYEPR